MLTTIDVYDGRRIGEQLHGTLRPRRIRLPRAAAGQPPGDVVRTGHHVPAFHQKDVIHRQIASPSDRDEIVGGHPAAPEIIARGVWARRDVFARVNGMDERYESWGREDVDFVVRLQAATAFDQFHDTLAHLYHLSTAQIVNGESRNAHLPWMSWQPEGPIGRLRS